MDMAPSAIGALSRNVAHLCYMHPCRRPAVAQRKAARGRLLRRLNAADRSRWGGLTSPTAWQSPRPDRPATSPW
ncbi:hypothetical protein [Lysobacter gummosus]|uniref:hypothetical protein n=1 Tax=Lysobacter gummosus TaxID=262324 RepID=UPI00363FEED2